MGKVMRRVLEAVVAVVFVLVFAVMSASCSCSEETEPQKAAPVRTIVACKARGTQGQASPLLDPTTKTIVPGAIPGQFSVTSTGEATYSMRLTSVPGRPPLEPDLSVTYSSAGDDGILGMGFSLTGAGSSITRCPQNMAQDGEIRAVRFDAEDRLCLDGRRMVPVADAPGTIEYRLIPDANIKVVGHFPPDAKEKTANNVQFFEAFMPSGVLIEYSKGDAGRVLAKGGVPRAFLATVARDQRGSYMEYSYCFAEADGYTTEVALTEIRYTGFAGATSIEPTRAVRFVYSPKATEDARLYFAEGMALQSSLKLDEVQMFGPGDALVRRYAMTYSASPTTRRTLLQQIEECGADGACKPPTRFQYKSNEFGFKRIKTTIPAPTSKLASPMLMDLNRDGLDDYVAPDTNSSLSTSESPITEWFLSYNQGAAADPPYFGSLNSAFTQAWDSVDNPSEKADPTSIQPEVATALDHNQDGRADLWLHDVYGSRLKDIVLLAAPNHMLSPIETEVSKPFPLSAPPPPPTMTTHGASIHFADIDGDGQPDRIHCVDRSDASVDFPELPHWKAQIWRPADVGKPAGFDPQGEEIERLVGVPCTAEFYPVDVDGDSRTELVIPEFSDFDGARFTAGSTYFAFARRAEGSWEAFDTKLPLAQTRPDRRVLFLDVNADGLPDCIQSGFSDRRLKTFMNTGRTFDEAPTDSLYWDTFGEQDYHFRMAVALDADGDGRQDLLMPISGGVWPNVNSSFPKWYILRATGALNGPTFEPVDPKIPLEAQIGDVITVADPRTPRIGDVNGDGAPDVVTFLDGVLNIFEHQAPDQDLLIAVSDGMAEVEPDQPGFVPSVSLSYGHLIDPWETNDEAPDDPALESYLYVARTNPANDCEYPRRCAVGPRRVVSGYALSDGQGGQRRYGLRYRDGRYDRLGNGFLGFEKRITTDLDTGAGSIDLFDNRTVVEQNGMRLYPFAGQVMHRWSFAPGLPGQPIPSQVELSFVDTTPTLVPTEGGKSYFTIATKQRSRRIQGDYPSAQMPAKSLEEYVAKVEASGGSGVVLSDTTTTVTDFDEFGNVLDVDVVTADVDLTLHRKRTFKNDEDRWILGQLQTQEECSSASGLSRCRLLTRTTTDFGEVHTASLSSDEGIPDTKLDLVYERNELGGVTSVTADDAFGHHRVSSTVFDAEGIYPTAQVNAAQHTTLVEYDARFGSLARVTDPNQLVTEWHFDGLGQAVLEVRPDGSQTTILRSRNQEKGLWRVMVRTITTGGADDLTVLDSLGRPIQHFSHGPDPADDPSAPPMLMQVIHYDRWTGKVAKRSVPTSEGTPQEKLLFDEFTYDAIGREVRHKTPWNAVTETLFEGLVVKRWDPLLHLTTTALDALGRPKAITDAANGLTQYTYGPFNTLYTVTDPGGSLTRVTPDAFGRARMIEDPDRGTTLQIHNGFNELESSTDAQGRVVKFDRDALGRPVVRTDIHGLEVLKTTWEWDTAAHGIGALHKLTSPDAVKTFSYDTKGRIESQLLAVTGEPELLSASVTYDEFGRLDTLSYPAPNGAAPFAVKRAYDSHGFLLTVRDALTDDLYWRLTEVDHAGRVGKERFGNDVVTERTYYEDRQALKSIKTTLTGAPTLQNLSYEYDLRLNLKSRRDALQKQLKTERFRHDELNRLTCSYFSDNEDPLAPCAESFEYSPSGNLTYKSDVGVFTYGDPKHPHGVTGAGGDAYGHDAVGNQITRPGGMTVTYTAFDLPLSITQGSNVYTFGYDGNHARIHKTTPTTETLYFDDLYERVSNLATSATEHRYYVRSPERVIAVVTRGGANPGARYLHTDNLGSVETVTDGHGGVEERRSNKPFGERRNAIWGQPPQGPFTSKTTKGFTGHEEDAELGLVNAKGRMYDPRIGRFLSADPIVSNLWHGQSLNAYSYVQNSPLAYIDPSGFQGCPASGCIPDALIPTAPPGGGIVMNGGQPILIVEDITVHGRSPSSEAADVGAAAPPVDVSTTGASSVSEPRGVIAPPNESWRPSSSTLDGDGATDPLWPTVDAPPPTTLSDYIGKVLRLELPPDEIGVYSLAYSIKQDFVDPFRRWIADEPRRYLADGSVRKFSGHRDYSGEMSPVLGNIVLMVLPGVNGLARAETTAAAGVVDPAKFRYLFGEVGGNAHNIARTAQNASQMARIGVYNTAEGRALLLSHFESVAADSSNILRTFSNQYGTFQLRESLFAGPGGLVKFESTWQVLEGGGLRFTTAIPFGG